MRARRIRGLTPSLPIHLVDMRHMGIYCAATMPTDTRYVTSEYREATCGECLTGYTRAMSAMADHDETRRAEQESRRTYLHLPSDTRFSCLRGVSLSQVEPQLRQFGSRWSHITCEACWNNLRAHWVGIGLDGEALENVMRDFRRNDTRMDFNLVITNAYDDEEIEEVSAPALGAARVLHDDDDDDYNRRMDGSVTTPISHQIEVDADGTPNFLSVRSLTHWHMGTLLKTCAQFIGNGQLRASLAGDGVEEETARAKLLAWAQTFAAERPAPELEPGHIVEGWDLSADRIRGVVLGGGASCRVRVLTGSTIHRVGLLWPTVKRLTPNGLLLMGDYKCRMNGARADEGDVVRIRRFFIEEDIAAYNQSTANQNNEDS